MKTVSFIGIMAVLLLSMTFAVSGENYIGIILDGYQKDCVVQSRGEDYECGECRHLFTGDKVIKKPDIKAVQIKWVPYAGGKELDRTSLIAVFAPPKDKRGFVQKTKEFLGIIKTAHAVSVGATRDNPGEPGIPQPGNNATLLAGQKALFMWEIEGGKQVIFKDSNNAEVFRKEFKGQSFLELSPEEIGMKPSVGYTCSLSGSRSDRQYKIRLLPDEIALQVNRDLSEIEKEVGSDVEKRIKKAAYLQFLSDSYDQEIDLYWLSYRLLEGIKSENLNKDDRAVFDGLRKNYLQHVREAM